MSETFTLREAQERVDQIVDEIASLCGVAADDMGSDEGMALESIFHHHPNPEYSGMVTTTQAAKDFARRLTERIIADGPLYFEWKEEAENADA
ncbi:MAG: hypothetical protein D3X82_13925 [Candidatus Leucobacter sulfamidivorax]|nr:hypothetical protein [Candidatus Leucobacter sulfamidivorax]